MQHNRVFSHTERVHGETASPSVTATLSCAGALAVWVIVSPRMLYVLAEQGDMPEAAASERPTP
jgi:amino acid transporter